jgi:hypothetical protein
MMDEFVRICKEAVEPNSCTSPELSKETEENDENFE